jgi:hypothetical protein
METAVLTVADTLAADMPAAVEVTVAADAAASAKCPLI